MVRLGVVAGQWKAGSPSTYVNPPIELSRDGSLVFLDTSHKLIHLIFRTIFLRLPGGFELGLGGLYAFLQTFNLVYRQPRLPEEKISHGDVEVPLGLKETSVTNAWIRAFNPPSRIPNIHAGVLVSERNLSVAAPKVKLKASHPLIHKISLGLKMLGYSFDALFQPIRQLAPVAPPTHGLVHLIQHLETSGQPRKVGLIVRGENGIRQRWNRGCEREAG